MSKLLVAGAINTDLIAYVPRAPEAGETVAGGHFEQHGGGKGANQAVAAARSMASVHLLSAVGNDDFGTARRVALESDGIDITGVQTMDDSASGVAIIIVEQSGENRICDLPGAREQLAPEQCVSVYEATSPAAILATNELPLDCLHALFTRARKDNVPIWFNIAPFSEGAHELLSMVDTLMVNRGEAAEVLGVRGKDREAEQLATGLRDLGVHRVIITLGSQGVLGLDASGASRIDAIPVDAVDTTGAGDTFGGAFAAELLRGSSFQQAIDYANHAAAISVTRRGAQTSIPTRAEIEAKM